MRVNLFALLFFFIMPSFPLLAQKNILGRVFEDTNGDDIMGDNEPALANVMVSDGLSVVKTDLHGSFWLPHNPDARFIFVVCPGDYTIPTFYQQILPDSSLYNFGLRPRAKKTGEACFIQISDTETSNDKAGWIGMLQKAIKSNAADFLIHTGDICYADGMRFHAAKVNASTIGVPVYYCVGNHDLVDGPYGEALFESLFGPSWYAFESGNSLFVVTPMLNGDATPSYTQDQVYRWLVNLLKAVPREQPKFVFNHDLLTGDTAFLYRGDAGQFVNLNEHNLKAWVYGHWHNNFVRRHSDNGPVSICTGVAQRGGIDHAQAQFRVFSVKEDGDFSTQVVQSFVDHKVVLVLPQHEASPDAEGNLPVMVNTYNSEGMPVEVSFSLNDTNEWVNLSPKGEWSWTGSTVTPVVGDSCRILVRVRFADGENHTVSRVFFVADTLSGKIEATQMPGSAIASERSKDFIQGPEPPLRLEWFSNLGSQSYMSSPLLSEDMAFLPVFDPGDPRNAGIHAVELSSGKQLWSYSTYNAVKGKISLGQKTIFTTDMQGFVYAIDAATGSKKWVTRLEMPPLPAYVSGTVLSEGRLFTGDGQSLCALDQETGQLLWRNEDWSGGVGGPAGPVVDNGLLFVSSNWNGLYAHDLTTGQLRWRQKSQGIRFRDAAPVVWKNTMYLAAQTRLLALDVATGEITRNVETGWQLNAASRPLIVDSLLIVGSANGGVIAFNRHDFSICWQFLTGPSPTPSTPYAEPPVRTVEASPVLINNNYIVVGASDGNLYVLDVRSGEAVWAFESGAPIMTSVVVNKNRLLVADISGNLYSFIGK